MQTDETVPETVPAAEPVVTAPAEQVVPAAEPSKKTRKPRSDKGKGRKAKPVKAVKTPKAGKKVKAAKSPKANSKKRGPRGALKLYYILGEPEAATLLGDKAVPLTSVKVKAAVKEVLALSQQEENRTTHLGQGCTIVGVMDTFTITGSVKVQVKAERD